MSSKTKTENLGLNQWALDDVFQMTDFNEDNAKIDAAVGTVMADAAAALGELRAPGISAVKLADFTMDNYTQTIDIDMTKFVAEKKYFQYLIFCPLDIQIWVDGYNPQKIFDTAAGDWADTSLRLKSRRGFFKLYTDVGMGGTEEMLRVYDGSLYKLNVKSAEMRSIRLGYDYEFMCFPVGSRVIMLGLKLAA